MIEFIDVKYKNIIDIPMLKIEKEKVTSLIGSSGSGKSTLLKMLNKMISPQSGKILFNGKDLETIDSVFHRRQAVMLSQNPVIFEGNIRDNLNAGLVFQGKERLPDALNKQIMVNIKLNKDLNENACTLSGGERQRLALARIMILNPTVFLLDEPTSALDSETEEMMIELITEYAKNNKKTIVMVTHSVSLAEKFSDAIIEISEGKNRRFEYARNH